MSVVPIRTHVSILTQIPVSAFPAGVRSADPGEVSEIGRRNRLAIDRVIALIDQMISRQVEAILALPRFRDLEASWRSLIYLINRADTAQGVKIKLLSLSWPDLCRDVTRALEFDQSRLFSKIYEEEFGTAGGEPFGLIVGDYKISHKRSASHTTDDIAALTGIAQVAAAAFVPFIAAAAPELLGLDDFGDLTTPIDLTRIFSGSEYEAWRRLRSSEDSRFLGLVLPDCIIRGAYDDLGAHDEGFRYRTGCESANSSDVLWSSAAYAFAATIIEAYGRSGWFVDMRGTRRGEVGGGLVDSLPPLPFSTDSLGVADRTPIAAELDPAQERTLDELGMIPLVHTFGTPHLAFYTNASLLSPPRYDEAAARANARLSSMLQYILCVSRFAHYIKILGRERVGSFTTPQECQRMLQQWIMRYCTADDDAPASSLARFPLREANIEVREKPGQPGVYTCTAQLKPHFQLDQIVSAFKLVTELAPRGVA